MVFVGKKSGLFEKADEKKKQERKNRRLKK